MRVTGVLNNVDALSLGTNSCKKNGTWQIWTAHIKQKSSDTLTVISLNNSRAVYIASYESCELKWFSRCCNKVEERHIQEQQPNQIHCYIQNMGFVNRMDQSMANYRIGIQMKKCWWSPFVWMVDVVLRAHCVVLTKMKAMSLCLFYFFENTFSIQFFWNIQRKADYPRAMQEFEISHQMLVIMSQSISRCNLNTAVLRTSLSIENGVFLRK